MHHGDAGKDQDNNAILIYNCNTLTKYFPE